MKTYSISLRHSLLWMLALAVLPFKALAAPAQLSIESFTIKAGETKEMVIDLTNPGDEITLVQFDLRLPEGLAVGQTGGEYDIDIADRTTWRKHSLDANALENGLYRFLLASSSNAVLSGAEGAIIKVALTAAGDFTGGTIRLENILLVSPDEKETKPADVELVIADSTPETGTAYLSAETVRIKRGGEATMSIDLTNPDDEITLVQFDLRLPEGLSIKQTGGEYDIDIADRTTWRKHSLDANQLESGVYRFLLASSSNAVLAGANGTIIKVTLVATSSYQTADCQIDNILLVTPDEKEIKPASFTTTIKTGIHGVMADAQDGVPLIYNLSGQRLTTPQRGVNIVGGKKVVVK